MLNEMLMYKGKHKNRSDCLFFNKHNQKYSSMCFSFSLGEYICSYIISSSSNNTKITIIHQDSAVMDVALLPNIGISTNPQFPHCTSGTDLLSVTINCQIPPAINKTYNVTWSTEGITAAIIAAKYSKYVVILTHSFKIIVVQMSFKK